MDSGILRKIILIAAFVSIGLIFLLFYSSNTFFYSSNNVSNFSSSKGEQYPYNPNFTKPGTYSSQPVTLKEYCAKQFNFGLDLMKIKKISFNQTLNNRSFIYSTDGRDAQITYDNFTVKDRCFKYLFIQNDRILFLEIS